MMKRQIASKSDSGWGIKKNFRNLFDGKSDLSWKVSKFPKSIILRENVYAGKKPILYDSIDTFA